MSAAASEPLDLRPMRSRSWWLAVGVTGVVLLGIAVWAVLTQPQPWWGVALVGVLVVMGVVAGTRRAVLVTQEGTPTLVARDLGVRVRRVPVDAESTVTITGVGSRVLLTVARGGRRGTAELLTLTEYVQKSRPPEVLRRLADVLAASGADGAGAAAKALRAQAEQVAAGTPLTDTPLAGRTGARPFGMRF